MKIRNLIILAVISAIVGILGACTVTINGESNYIYYDGFNTSYPGVNRELTIINQDGAKIWEVFLEDESVANPDDIYSDDLLGNHVISSGDTKTIIGVPFTDRFGVADDSTNIKIVFLQHNGTYGLFGPLNFVDNDYAITIMVETDPVTIQPNPSIIADPNIQVVEIEDYKVIIEATPRQ